MNGDILDDKEDGGDEQRPDFNSVLHADDNTAHNRPRGISLSSAVLLFLLASLLGGAIGWLGPNLLNGKKPTVSNTAKYEELSARLDIQDAAIKSMQDVQSKQAASVRTLTETQKETSDGLVQITQSLKATNDTGTTDEAVDAAADPKTDAANIDTAIDGPTETAQNVPVQSAPDAAETLPSTKNLNADMTAITQRLDKLEARQILPQKGEDSNGADLTALTERLAVIDTQQIEIEALASGAKTLGARVTTLEDDVAIMAEAAREQSAQAALASQSETTLTALISTFPQAALEQAASQQMQAQKQGIVARSLSRHVKVIDNEDPLLTIAAAQRTLQTGDIAGAIAALETLDPAISASAKDWIETARRAHPK